MPLRYACCICKGSMSNAGPHEHRLEPCGLVIVGNADRDWGEQREQNFWCHFECFRRLLNDDSVLAIQDTDFRTNGEIQEELAAEEAAQQRDST